MNDYDKEIIKYAVGAYGFLIPELDYTYTELANSIQEHYCMCNPANAEVVRILLKVAEENEDDN